MLKRWEAAAMASGATPPPSQPSEFIKPTAVARRSGLRIGSCSTKVVDEGARWDVTVVDLREIASGLTPDHLPGERLSVELIREGRQPRQAIGYLPDGDMVVVNDATHVIDQGPVEVTVLSTRPTNQGLMLFARLTVEGGSNRDVGASAPAASGPTA